MFIEQHLAEFGRCGDTVFAGVGDEDASGILNKPRVTGVLSILHVAEVVEVHVRDPDDLESRQFTKVH